MSADLKVVIATVFDAIGLNKADKQLTAFERKVKSLGKVIGGSLALATVQQYGKAAVKAFTEDEVAATRLSKAVDNLGMAFANPYIADYVQNLEKTSRVADDELRPAFQALLQQTASLAKTQSILNTAIEVSRGAGVSLTQVSNDLAQAYVGNTKGLKKYNLGLSQAALKAASFEEIQASLNKQFAGSNSAYLNTYAGSIASLSLSWQNLKETVGGSLLLMASFGSGGESQGLKNLADILDRIGSATSLISKGWDSVAKLLNFSNLGTSVLGGFNPYKTSTPEKKSENVLTKYQQELAKIEADRLKQIKLLTTQQKALTAEQKKQAALKKAGSIFDLTQIQIIAALKGKISDEDRKRLELQMALETENVTEAQRLTFELAKSQGLTTALATTLASLPAASNPFAAWKGYLDEIELQAKRISAFSPSTPNTGQIGSLVQNFTPDVVMPPQTTQPGQPGFVGPTVVKVEIDGKEVASAVQSQNNSGNYTGFSRLGDWRTL